MANELYLLRISLVDSKPAIWRRFCVPANINLASLHNVIQKVMGWQDYHLHLFEIDGIEYSTDDSGEMDCLPSKKYRLNSLVTKGDEFFYLYDFGDSWEHRIKVWDVDYKPETPFKGRFKVVAGANACPPEDVGGMDGYYDFLKAYNNPKHPEHEEMRLWARGHWHPGNLAKLLAKN
jgi:hypothetical protein